MTTNDTSAWQLRLPGRVACRPALANGMVLVAAGKSLVAVSTADGAVRWSIDLGEKPAGPPVVAGALVAVPSSGRVRVVHRELGSVVGTIVLEQGARLRAIDDAGRLLVHGPGSVVRSIGCTDGADCWRWPVTATSVGLPIGVTVDGPTVLVHHGQTCDAYHADTGAPRWSVRYGNAGFGKAPPAVAGEAVLVGTGTAEVMALRRHDGLTLWTNDDHFLGHLYARSLVSDPLLLPAWMRTAPHVLGTPAVEDGIATVARSDRKLVSYDLATGEQRWSAWLQEEPLRDLVASAGLVLASTGTAIHAWHANTGRPAWSITPRRRWGRLTAPVADGTVVIYGSGRRLLARSLMAAAR